MNIDKLIGQLNAETKEERLEALLTLTAAIEGGRIPRPPRGNDVNNHIHTSYSFSPYSPAKAVWMSLQAGLATAGLMDHDSAAGAEEFIRAGEIAGLLTTVGVECRVDMSGTSVAGRRLNNPDQAGIAYVALHGIPHTQLGTVREFFRPFIEKRVSRSRAMTEKLNGIFADFGILPDFDRDVLPLSNFADGGTVTERHLLFALAKAIIKKCGKGAVLVDFLRQELGVALSGKPADWLADAANPFYDYDLLGALKSSFLERFYIPAAEECPKVSDWLALCERVGGISAYAYLGDVGLSVTGDKKAQRFEDAFLPDL
ncbi:MAG: PHP domain-containing protein, partial [Oscillospiraceae bacterium]|nr:PHP domain-containing protein [Oscillospiraceae bacterium]